jgi:dolichol-phosphate mannosyltransferase
MISIIIPTYNERKAIIKTIKDVQSVLKAHTFEIIVCDDDSPDKTWKLVNDTFKDNKNIFAIRRTSGKKGLAPAVIEGFDKAKGELLLVMDADGQHDQEKIPTMITASKGADIVIGSRFVKGGSLQGWSKKRICISKIAATLAKPLLKQSVSDPMSGFFLIKKEPYLKARKHINPQGYKILLELLFASPQAKIKEVGFRFGLRKQGESKLGSKVITEYIHMLGREGWKQHGKLIRFCIVGASGIIVNLGILYFLTECVGIYYLLSSAIAIEISIITNFILNNYWTWKRKHKGFWKRLGQFQLVSLSALIINEGILFSLTELFGVWYLVAQLVGIVVATGVNFIVNNKWTFRNKRKH